MEYDWLNDKRFVLIEKGQFFEINKWTIMILMKTVFQ